MSLEYEVEEEGEWFNKLSCTNICAAGYVVSRRLAAHIRQCKTLSVKVRTRQRPAALAADGA